MSHAGRIEIARGVVRPGRLESDGRRSAVRGFRRISRDRVFEPFFTTKHRGTGLGLPTARRIVEAHGGELTLANAPNGGTAARVTLPRHLA